MWRKWKSKISGKINSWNTGGMGGESKMCRLKGWRKIWRTWVWNYRRGKQAGRCQEHHHPLKTSLEAMSLLNSWLLRKGITIYNSVAQRWTAVPCRTGCHWLLKGCLGGSSAPHHMTLTSGEIVCFRLSKAKQGGGEGAFWDHSLLEDTEVWIMSFEGWLHGKQNDKIHCRYHSNHEIPAVTCLSGPVTIMFYVLAFWIALAE